MTAAERYMYHSFPRRAVGLDKGLHVLESIARSGLLLTPELTTWPGEFMPDGSRGEPITAYQKRVCFTELRPDELAKHSQLFGSYAIEFEVDVLRRLGALPVFYVPVANDGEGLPGIGLAMVGRLADVRDLLERLSSFLEFANIATEKHPMAQLGLVTDGATGELVVATTVMGGPEIRFPKDLIERIVRANPSFEPPVPAPGGSPLGITAVGLRTFLRMLTWGIQSIEVQLNGIRGMGQLFVPTERIGSDELLTYYRQREWRLLGDVVKNGVAVNGPLAEEEIAILLQLDSTFFSRVLETRLGQRRLVDECQYFRAVDGIPVLGLARRVICPSEVVDRAKDILNRSGFAELNVSALP